MSASPQRFSKAAIVHASYAQFNPGQKIQYPRVRSRMVLWCKAGTGTVTVNGKVCPLEAGRYLVLPWEHAIAYQASTNDPFFLGGIHVVPDHRMDRGHRMDYKAEFRAVHNPHLPISDAPHRHGRDIKIPELASLKIGWLDSDTPLPHLLECIAQLFIRGDPEEWLARQLARPLLHELTQSEQRKEMHTHGVPPELERMKQYILFHIRQPISLRDLVEFSKLSPATVGRMFRQHLHTTPVAWILAAKMRRARELLRTRRLTVAEVAGLVGIRDQFYFAKRFKQATGQSPLHYRQQSRWW